MTISRLAAAAVVAACAAGSSLAQSERPPVRPFNGDASFSQIQDFNGDFFEDGEVKVTPFTIRGRFDLTSFDSLTFRGAFASVERNGLASVTPPLNASRPPFGAFDMDPGTDDAETFFGANAFDEGGFLNGVYQFENHGALRASLGFGVGYGRPSYRIDNAFEGGDSAVVYQGFAGLRYAISRNLGIRLRGRYVAASGSEFGDDRSFTKSQFNSFGAMIGLVWRK